MTQTVQFNLSPALSPTGAVSDTCTWYSRHELAQFKHVAARVASRQCRKRQAPSTADEADETDCDERDSEEDFSVPRGLERYVDAERQKEKSKVRRTILHCQRLLLLARKGGSRAVGRALRDGSMVAKSALSSADARKLAAVAAKLTAGAAEVARQQAISDYFDAHPMEAAQFMIQQNVLLLQQHQQKEQSTKLPIQAPVLASDDESSGFHEEEETAESHTTANVQSKRRRVVPETRNS